MEFLRTTARLKVIPGAPHGMCSTHKDLINVELLAFVTKNQAVKTY
jgi:non-heme chloroperoxidase